MANTITITTGGTTTAVTIPEVQNTVEVTYGNITKAERDKLAGIEAGATADMTGAEIKAAYELEPNAFTDTLKNKLDTIELGATADQIITTTNGLSGFSSGGNYTLSVDGTVVRTTGNQSIAGTKTFTGSLSVNGAYDFPTTIGSATQVLKVNSNGDDLEFGDASVVAELNHLNDVNAPDSDYLASASGNPLYNALVFDGSEWVFFNQASPSPVPNQTNIQFLGGSDAINLSKIGLDGANNALSINSTASYGASGVNLFVDGGARIDGAIEVSSAGAVQYSLPTSDGTANQLLATDGSGAVTFVTPSVTNLSDVTSAGSGAIITSAERTKLTGIESSADVTDTANVRAAGALMDDEVTNLAQVKSFDSSDYATAAALSSEASTRAAADNSILNALGAKLENIVADTTPQLGGNLDVNGNKIVSTSNGDIDIEPNGTGDVLLGNFKFDADQTVGASQDNYVLTYDNTTGKISLEASSGGGGSSVWTTSGSDIYYTTGNVGIGTTSPAASLHVADANGEIHVEDTTNSLTTKMILANHNVIIGAGQSSTLPSNAGHVKIGYQAGANNSAQPVTAIGNSALKDNIGQYHVAIGNAAGRYGGGSFGVAVGDQSGQRGMNYGSFLGYKAGQNGTGNKNVAVGYQAATGVNGSSTFANTVAVGYQALTALTTGASNTAVGYQAADALTTGNNNTALGYQALSSFTTGSNTVAVGAYANSDGTSSNSVYIGSSAGRYYSTGDQVVAIGYNAASVSASGQHSVYIGGNAGAQAANADRSIAIGASAGYFLGGVENTLLGGGAGSGSGASNFSQTVGIGYQALTALTTGVGNTAVGYQAGDSITESSYNTVVGYQAAQSQFDHSTSVTALGYQAGYTTTLGGIFIGKQAGYSVNNSGNLLIGDVAGQNITSGSSNVGVGSGALRSTGSGSGSVALGSDAGRYTTDGGNTLLGHRSGRGVAGSNFSNTVAVGHQALTALTTGAQNTAVGYQAGAALTTGYDNTLLGYNAGKALTAWYRNTVIGKDAFSTATISWDSVYIGQDAGKNFTSVLQRNTLVGRAAGNGATNTQHSTLIGYAATVVSNAQGVTAIGNAAKGNANSVAVGRSVEAGQNSVAIGYDAGNTTGSGNIFVGYQAGDDETGSNKLYIENSNSTTPLIYGEFDNDILRVNGTLQVNDPSSTGYAFPTATGTTGQVLEVDASGDLVFATPSGGGGGGGGLGGADQTLTADRTIDTNGYNLDIELDPTGTADTFTIHDGTHDLFQVDTGTTGTLFSVNDVSGLPKLEVDEDEGVIAKSIKVDDSALTAAGQYGKGAEIWYQGTSTPTAGSIYYLDSSGNWANTDASAVATAKGMLSVSAGTDSDVDGMVIKGFVYVGTDPGGNVGDVVYLSETANQLTTTAPTTASAVVRVCGYKVGTNVVYFDPSKDWIELS